MDYMSVMEHVQALFELCFPELPVKLIYLCNPDIMMKLSPDEMRERGYGCLCVLGERSYSFSFLHAVQVDATLRCAIMNTSFPFNT